ncbi:SH3 domain-containing protein [Haladaptatus litoreus]|uniref:N-acetylmuramoyl-L-alanine amidase n=1 Tax=Haladaptatus litoreus TaxID=553468 RepID=A0A1N7BLC4_9EURY|nr:N-acetylmuramoyl-L-alanine amidase [Haladaptatus litoreus]SIR52208.1 SH3 domain-containing protein [Haladaptatus litoreus]
MHETRRTILKTIGAVAGAGAISGQASAKNAMRLPATKPEMAWAPADESNYDEAERESDLDIRWFIVHVAQGEADWTVNYFQNPDANVSAHYVADHETGDLTQMLAEEDIGWHAGNWPYNQHSLGIEHSGWVNETEYTDELYEASAKIVRWSATEFDFPKRVRRYDIAPCNAKDGEGGVIGHDQIPNPNDCTKPGGISGHYDPGSLWNWGRYEGFIRRWDVESGENAVVLSDDAVHHGPDDHAKTMAVPSGAVGTATGNVLVRKGTQWYKLDFGGTHGWIPADDVLYARFDAGQSVQTTSGLSVRAEPSGERLGVVPEGTAGVIADGPVDTGGYRWWKVEYDGGQTGWSADYWLTAE